MKKCKLLMIGAVEACVLLLGVYFEPTFGVRGHLHGEAFFEGRSTSWWRDELRHWHLVEVMTEMDLVWPEDAPPPRPDTLHLYVQEPSSFERACQRWLPWIKREERNPEPVGPRLLSGDAEALPVLRALLDDPSPKIRQFARIGLKMDEE